MPARLTRDRPRVLVTADAIGGVWTYAVGLARGLTGAGLEVEFVVLGPAPSMAQRVAAEAVVGLTLHEIEGPLDWLACDSLHLESVAVALSRLADRRGVDLVHLNSPSLAGLVELRPPVIGVCHSCVATWWATVRPGERLPPALAWRRDLLGRGYAACDMLLAPTQAFARDTHAAYGVNPAVVHNGAATARPGAGERERFALAAGRLWDEGKGAAMLETIAGVLSAPLVALGALDGPGGERVRVDHAHAQGCVDERSVADWMARAPVFVSTARYEPFGLAVLEAGQAGCALVLSDIPTFRELWDGAAVFAAPDDARGFVTAIETQLDDVEARRRAGLAASRRAKIFSVQTMVAGVLDAYRALVPDVFAARPRMGAAL